MPSARCNFDWELTSTPGNAESNMWLAGCYDPYRVFEVVGVGVIASPACWQHVRVLLGSVTGFHRPTHIETQKKDKKCFEANSVQGSLIDRRLVKGGTFTREESGQRLIMNPNSETQRIHPVHRKKK